MGVDLQHARLRPRRQGARSQGRVCLLRHLWRNPEAAVTRSQVDAIIDRLDAHAAKLDAVRSDVDKLKGGLIVIGALLFSVLVPLVASIIGK